MKTKAVPHPTSNPELPSYVHEALAEIRDDLELMGDCWKLLKGSKQKYLHREQMEKPQVYKARLERVNYPSMLRDAIIAYVGVLSRYETRNLPPTMEANKTNIDNEGSSLRAFMMEADILLMREGGCLIYGDMSPGKPRSRGEELAQGRRPWLNLVARGNVLNWKEKTINGAKRVTQVTIMEMAETVAGTYGSEHEPVYRVMRGGDWALFKMVKDPDNVANNGWTVELITVGEFLTPSGQKMAHPPAYWYGSTGTSFGEGDIPLLGLAKLTIDHLKEYSNIKDILFYTARPTPTRTGALGSSPDGSTPPMILGPTKGMDLPLGGTFSMVEVAGTSLDKHQDHLVHIESLIDRQTLSFLFGNGQRTATQSTLETGQIQATLSSIVERKVACFRALLELWVQFTGETLADDAGMKLEGRLLEKQLGVEEIRLVESLVESRLLSRKSATWLIDKARFLPDNIDPDDEQQRLADEKRAEDSEAARGLESYEDVVIGADGLPRQLPPRQPPAPADPPPVPAGAAEA